MSLSRIEAWKKFGDPDAWISIRAGVPVKERKPKKRKPAKKPCTK